MEFDKSFFIEYLKSIKDDKDKLSYIYRLYKTFNLINKNTKGKIELNKRKIAKYEDDVYNINGVVLGQKERILFELNRIIEKLKLDNSSRFETLSINVQRLKRAIQIEGLSDEKILLSLKKEISIIQAKLDLPITFLYASSLAFMEIYRNAYINSLDNNGYDGIKHVMVRGDKK